MSYYVKHIFICTNQKAPGKPCCADSGGLPYFDYLKARLKELGLFGPGKIRISKSGCLGRCAIGPCMVIYPEAIWYTYHSKEDLETIIQSHLIQGEPVRSLFLEQV